MDGLIEFINKNLIWIVTVIGVLTVIVSFFLIRAIVKLSKSKQPKETKNEGYDELYSKPFYDYSGDGEQPQDDAPQDVEDPQGLHIGEEGFRPKIVENNEEPTQKYGEDEPEPTNNTAEETPEYKKEAKNDKNKKLELGDEGFRPIIRDTGEEPSNIYGEVVEDQGKQNPETKSEHTPAQPTLAVGESTKDGPKPKERITTQERLANIAENTQDKDAQGDITPLAPAPKPVPKPVASKQAQPKAAPQVNIGNIFESNNTSTRPKYKIMKTTSGMRFKIEGTKQYMSSITYPDLISIKNAINMVNHQIAKSGLETTKTDKGFQYVCKLNGKIVAESEIFKDNNSCRTEAELLRKLLMKA